MKLLLIISTLCVVYNKASRLHPPDFCALIPDSGSTCHPRHNRYFYDAIKQKCVRFLWSECSRNENNFETLEECENTCSNFRLSNLCNLKPKNGEMCGVQEVKLFYWNAVMQRCELFVHKGCPLYQNGHFIQKTCEVACKWINYVL